MIPWGWFIAWVVFIGLFSFGVGWIMARGEWPWESWRRR